MAKEFERAGIPTAFISTLLPLAQSVGPNRIIAGKAVTNPLGDPSLPPEQEREFRRTIVRRALDSLQTDTLEQAVFQLDDQSRKGELVHT